MNFKKFLLPNSMYFGTLPLGKDLIAALFGLEKTHRELIILKDPRVKKANRYMMKQYKRLEKAAKEGNIEKYENISTCLLTKSKVYQYIAMHRTEGGWFWELKACRIRAVMRKLQRIASKRLSNINYQRTWIPKGEDKYGRPLGVPKLEWRIWSWMNLNIMEIWCHYQNHKPAWQHGGISGRGVVSAWSEVIQSKLNMNNIIEFDIKGFFNHITHDSIIKFIESTNMKFMTEWIKGSLKSLPSKVNTPPLSEERPEFIELGNIQRHIKEYEEYGSIKYSLASDFHEDWKEAIAFAKAHGLEPLEEFKELIYEQEDITNQRNLAYGLDLEGRGTPQGYGISPFLCVMTVGKILEGIPGLLMYMDDGILTAPTRELLYERFEEFKLRLKSAGLEVAPKKTHVVKEQGVWRRDLKLLGLKYIPSRDVITSETRNGTKIEFPTAEWREGLEKHVWNGHSPGAVREILSIAAHKAAVKYGIMGLITSNVFAPNLEVTERELIEIGLNKAYVGMTTNNNTIMKDNREVWAFMDVPYNRHELVTTASTRMIRLILEKGFLRSRPAANRRVRLTKTHR